MRKLFSFLKFGKSDQRHSRFGAQSSAAGSSMIDWKIRYAKIMKRNQEVFDPKVSILEVGSGANGIALFLERKVTGIEPNPAQPATEWLDLEAGSVFEIPYPDKTFDVVVCVDVLEHLRATDRPRAIAEMVRVSKKKVILSCPCGSLTELSERRLADFFASTRNGVPRWLKEHLENGLPTVGALFREITKLGMPFEIQGNESLHQHYAGILLGNWFAPEPMRQKLEAKSPFDPLIGEYEWDLYYSFMFTIFTNERIEPIKRVVVKQESPIEVAGARLYAVYHKPWPISHLGRIEPIFVGPGRMKAPPGSLTDMLADGTGLDNARWSELSAFYKLWRDGPRSDVIGFCHYRRLFNFSNDDDKQVRKTLPMVALERHSDDFFDEEVIEAIGENEIICAAPVTFQVTAWDQYCIHHNINDYCWVINRIAKSHPFLLPFAVEQLNSKKLYATNLMIMRWSLFDEICTIWFGLLSDFETAVPRNRSNTYQNRDISFLAERVFDIWIRCKMEGGTRIIEQPTYFVEG